MDNNNKTKEQLIKAKDELEIKVSERTAELESTIELLKNEIDDRRKAEEAVVNVAKGISSAVGDKFFHSINEYLAKMLESDYSYIAEIINTDPGRARTLSLYADGVIIDNIDVDLTGTPCETIREKTRSYPCDIQKRFPLAHMMAKMNVEGYAGTPLFDSSGGWLGIMAVMYRKPIKNVQTVESLIKIFAARAASELERKLAENELRKAKEEIQVWNKELENRVQQKTEELVNSQQQLIQSEKLSAMGRMAGGLAHELNSPLAGLLPMLEQYRDQAEKGSKDYHELTLMLNAGHHMAKIVKDFGIFSRESKREFECLDLNEVIEDTLSFSAIKLKQKGSRIIKNYAKGLPVVQGEKTGLQQVVLNMLANACDAIQDGGEFTITTGVNKERKSVFMEFEDNGSGIEKEKLDKIFEPFYTTKKSGQGTGLGLSVSYGIILKHGGEISVESEPEKGTKFRVSLPACKPNNN